MGDKHAERDEADLKHFASSQNGVGLRVRAEHSLEKAHRDGEIGRAEEDPREADRAIGGQPQDHLDEETLRPFGFAGETPQQALDHEIKPVEQTPDNECPGGAVPEAADEHDDDEIDEGAGWAGAVAAERDVEVVAQESGERDMPAPPEIREADGGIRISEVVPEMKAHAERGADCAGGIAGKVEKDLARERDDAHPGIEGHERPAM